MFPLNLTQNFIETQLVSQPISSFKLYQVCSRFDNFRSDIIGLKIVVSKTQETLHLIYKTFPTGDPIQQANVIDRGLFRIESAIYLHIFPGIQRILPTHNKDCPQLPVPNFVTCFNNDQNDFLCIEDLRPTGYSCPDKNFGLNKEEMCLILQKLAIFHAYTYFLIQFEGERIFRQNPDLEILENNSWNNIDWDLMSGLYGVAFRNVVKEFIMPRSKVHGTKINKFYGTPDKAVRKWKETTLKTDTSYFPVIIHGDLWTNNILIKYNKARQPIDVKFIDFQQSRRSNIYEDLQYLLLTSSQPEDWKYHLENWCRIYFDAFTQCLGIIGAKSPQNFGFDYFMDEVKGSLVNGFVGIPFSIPVHWGRPNEDQSSDKNGNGKDEKSRASKYQFFHKKIQKSFNNSPKALCRLHRITDQYMELGLIT